MTDITEFRALLGRVAAGERLDETDAAAAFDAMMSGNATPSQMGGFLMALRVRGETVAEITGAARAMRAKALAIDAPPGAIDTVGTGGDGAGTFNISTAAALVVAGCGVPVAKHGNRNFSSKSGSADILAALGVNIDADHEPGAARDLRGQASASSWRRAITARRVTWRRRGSSSARAPSSTCWGRSRTPPACSASSSACSRRTG